MTAQISLRLRVVMVFIMALVPVRAVENALAPVVAQSDFKIRDPAFAKVVEKEVNQQMFRRKLSRSLAVAFESARKPVAKVSYRPDDEQGGTLVMWFGDPKNELAHNQLLRLWKQVEAYIVYRFQGNTIRESEAWAFGEAAIAK